MCDSEHPCAGSRVRTLPDLGGGVAARGALVLLDVHGAATATTAQSVRLVVALTETGGTLGWKVVSIPLSDISKMNISIVAWRLESAPPSLSPTPTVKSKIVSRLSLTEVLSF